MEAFLGRTGVEEPGVLQQQQSAIANAGIDEAPVDFVRIPGNILVCSVKTLASLILAYRVVCTAVYFLSEISRVPVNSNLCVNFANMRICAFQHQQELESF